MICSDSRIHVQEPSTDFCLSNGCFRALLLQVFCSGCSIAYSRNSVDIWEPFARLVLEATFEATLWATVLHALKHADDKYGRTVFLSAVGAGVFGNKTIWVEDAIHKAISNVEAHGVGLDIKVLPQPSWPYLYNIVLTGACTMRIGI